MMRILFATGLLALSASPALSQNAVEHVGGGSSHSALGFSYGGGRVVVDARGNPQPLDHPTIRSVTPSSPAALAGLAVGDTIVSVNGRDSRERPLFPDRRHGARYILRIRRADEEREVGFRLESPPSGS